jgi:hypothetical protein
MGLSRSVGDGLPTFSLDVLRLEITGPHENHLSVIDVPGILKTTTPGLTSKSDIALVRDMVLNYMRNPRSIMLAVVPANVDIATQEIIEIARELDPDGTRTLRILTKPDLVDKGAEYKIIEIVEEKQESQELGWVVEDDVYVGNILHNLSYGTVLMLALMAWHFDASSSEASQGLIIFLRRPYDSAKRILQRRYQRIMRETVPANFDFLLVLN